MFVESPRLLSRPNLLCLDRLSGLGDLVDFDAFRSDIWRRPLAYAEDRKDGRPRFDPVLEAVMHFR